MRAELIGRLSQGDLGARLGVGIPVITVDAEARPHPMMCSYLEMLADSPETLRLVIGGRSRSARNLAERRVATVLIVEPELTVYIKARVARGPVAFGELARFDLRVEDVLEDRPAAWEAGLGITGGITYAPVPDLESDWARATLAALRAAV
jgi:flavin reductase (DIM6/NTAB) family NADH-FMN oxidoreductase RutF